MSVAEIGGSEPAPEFERTPPHDINAEQGVLGGMLLSPDAIAEVVEVLRTQDFYRPAHQIIYDAVLDLYGRGDPADAVTIVGELTKRGEIGRVGGAPYLHTLISSVPTAANAGYYAKIVRERSMLRRLVEAGTRIVQMGYAADGADADDVLDRAQAEVFAIAEKRSGEDYVPLSEIMPGALDEIEAIGSRGGQMTGVPTGFSDLDALTNGLHAGQMVVVAARPAMGKALALDTPLVSPFGWTTMGEVKVGDYLLGADGKPTRVVAATEVMYGRPCYEVEFSDGEVIVADAEHQWRTTTPSVRAHGRRRAVRRSTTSAYALARGSSRHRRAMEPGRGGIAEQPPAVRSEVPWTATASGLGSRTISLPQVEATSRIGRSGTGVRSVLSFTDAAKDLAFDGAVASRRGHDDHGHLGVTTPRSISTTVEIAATLRRRGDGRTNHAVEVAAPFDLPAAEVPVDPYVLGVWLGAGAERPGELVLDDPELVEMISATGQLVSPSAESGRYVLPGLGDSLGALGVAEDACIPPTYLRGSERQRRALLAGVLDAAGSVTENGQVQLGFANKRLAEGAHELILSLGYRATMTAKPVEGRSSTYYRINFTPAETVFRLPRKLARQRKNVDAEARVRYIVDVRPVPSVPVRCVQVDNDDHMYLAGRSCIPTHNSTLALDFARAASIKHGLTSAFFSLEMGRNEITMRLLSAEARVALHAMRSGTMQDEDWTRLARRMSEVAEAPLFIDDSPNMSMMEIRAKCRRLKQQHDLRLVVIDYLQLMTSGKRVESRQVEVSEFSRSLKLLAKELQVPVIALSQLNRGPEQRTDKKPMVSDLRESGCVTAATRVMRADTNEEVSIGELFESGARDIPVWALDERLKYVPRTLTHAFSTGRKEVFRVRLASGKEIEATANHPFLTYTGWTALAELGPGARIAAARHVPPPLTIEPWPADRVTLLAHLIGDGSFVKRQPIRYASKDEACLSAVTEAARHFGVTAVRGHSEAARHFGVTAVRGDSEAARHFGVTAVRGDSEAARHFGVTAVRGDSEAARVTTLRLPAPYRLTHGRRDPIAEWLDELGLFGLRSHEKFVPAPVFRLPKEQVALFLRHLWATDGCVHWDAKNGQCRVSYASTSRRLVEGVSRLLLRFGILSRIKTVTKGASRPGYQLHLHGAENQLAFFEAVKVHGARGVIAAAAAERLRELRSSTNLDTVPGGVWGDVRQLLAERGMTHRESSAAMGAEFSGSAMWKRSPGRAPGRARLGRVAAVLDSAELELLATNDVFWDEIVAVECLGEQDVYDATVMGLHNFVANGISIHNSIEQDADMVILLHREDAYEKESPRAGEADLIVAKHRNGPTATVTVAFQGHYSRFVDMAQ
ncbi:replicative DNA helicase [Actinomadura fulvescens]|uniref:Replicative DNA helicase n=1 Tax=Actinomadura fulvescens TaxID=46160 RepID=A0ABN3Q6I5_9ACTN